MEKLPRLTSGNIIGYSVVRIGNIIGQFVLLYSSYQFVHRTASTQRDRGDAHRRSRMRRSESHRQVLGQCIMTVAMSSTSYEILGFVHGIYIGTCVLTNIFFVLRIRDPMRV